MGTWVPKTIDVGGLLRLDIGGGAVLSDSLGAFYTQHKQHRETVPDLRLFCEKHPQHFAISDPGKGHWKLRLATSDTGWNDMVLPA